MEGGECDDCKFKQVLPSLQASTLFFLAASGTGGTDQRVDAVAGFQ